jgi:cobalt/nickel transport protein
MKSISRKLTFGGLLISLAIAALISPFASTDPDGLDRVAQDLEFESKATQEPITSKLPPSQIFAEYSVKAVNEPKISTAIAGVVGTLITFGLAWGLGKVAIRANVRQDKNQDQQDVS